MNNRTETPEEYSERLLKTLREAEANYLEADKQGEVSLRQYWAARLFNIRTLFEKSLKYVIYE